MKAAINVLSMICDAYMLSDKQCIFTQFPLFKETIMKNKNKQKKRKERGTRISTLMKRGITKILLILHACHLNALHACHLNALNPWDLLKYTLTIIQNKKEYKVIFAIFEICEVLCNIGLL